METNYGESVVQNSKVWEQPLAHGASSTVDKDSKKDKEATWERGRGGGGEFGYLANVHEYHSSSSCSPRNRLWHDFKICKELFMENILGKQQDSSSKENRKADQLY